MHYKAIGMCPKYISRHELDQNITLDRLSVELISTGHAVDFLGKGWADAKSGRSL
jgi:hypothetical protein